MKMDFWCRPGMSPHLLLRSDNCSMICSCGAAWEKRDRVRAEREFGTEAVLHSHVGLYRELIAPGTTGA
jgi:hypothetical protein